ncbi:MAG: IS110 family transposase [Ignavibacteriaceae bacterium]
MKITKKEIGQKQREAGNYDQYLALDWSEKTMAIARMRSNSLSPQVIEERSDIRQLKEYLNTIQGRKILTIEETTSTHWLYVELKESVDKILICDPYRNRLLSEGAKTDKIDSNKLCQLLRSGLLKEVYHSDDQSYKIRKIVSAYEDLVKAGVRVQNQKSAIYRALGLKYKKDKISEEEKIIQYIEKSLDRSIQLYREEKKKYATMFSQLSRSNPVIKKLTEISGIGSIYAVTIYFDRRVYPVCGEKSQP